MKPSIKVVGLSGKMGTGKDHIARKYFISRGYKQISLAWHFKVWAIGQGLATWEEVFDLKPEMVRTMLQQMGTEHGRNVYGEDIWVNTMFAWIHTFSHYWNEHKFVIPDVRFPNEVEAIRRNGGKVYRIYAPKRNRFAAATDEQRNHPSEIALDTHPTNKFDGIIYNDPEDADSLDDQMYRILGLSESFHDLWWG